MTREQLIFPQYYSGESILKMFDKIIHPFFDQKDALMQQAGLLARSRDLLLPRLISGKLSVEVLDIESPPSMPDA